MKPKILFVDDDRALTELAVKTLQDEYEIYTANNGIEALEFLRNLKFELVVTDINMPIMSGEDLLATIKEDYTDIEVIIITVYPTVTTAVSTMKLGAYDYVIKPVDFNILSEKIRRSLEKRKLVQELQTEKQLHNKILTLFNDLQDLFVSTIETLAEVIEQKDAYTSGHCERIRENSLCVGRSLGLGSFELRDLEYGALLHDVGKISISEKILLKDSKLTDDEFEIMKTHSTKGTEIISHIKQLKGAIPGVKYHHERYDGKGYPEGLKGEEIPLSARIIAVSDSFDAMTSNRPYRKALSKDVAIGILREESGKQFDRKVIENFLESLQL